MNLQMWLRATQRAFYLTLPLVVVGSVSAVITSIPFAGWNDWVSSLLGSNWKQLFQTIGSATTGILGLAFAAIVGYTLTQASTCPTDDESLPMLGSVCSTIGLVVSVFSKYPHPELHLDKQAIALALLTGTLSAYLLVGIYHWIDKRMPMARSHGSLFAMSSSALIASLITTLLLVGLAVYIASVIGAITELIQNDVLRMFSNEMPTLVRYMLHVFLVHVLWIFGIHGHNILASVEKTYFWLDVSQNQSALQAGTMPPNIFSHEFTTLFVNLGGSGATWGLILALFIYGNAMRIQRQIAAVSAPLALFNINETIIYGLPIVFNRALMLPFVLLPLVNALIVYVLIASGFAITPTIATHWATPIFLSGYLATGSWTTVLVQVALVAMNTLVYLRCIPRFEREAVENERNDFDELAREVRTSAPDLRGVFQRRDRVGIMAHRVAFEFEQALKKDQVGMMFQPICDASRKVIGFEGLCRWHSSLPKGLQVETYCAIGENDPSCAGVFARWTIETACQQLAVINRDQATPIKVSVNLSPLQLTTPGLVEFTESALSKNGVSARNLQIEITERQVLLGSDLSLKPLQALRALGLTIAIDDFGMGHTSLRYLRELEIDSIKVDGSFVRDLETNQNSRAIISSISEYCSKQSLQMCAEFVETKSQMDILADFGCKGFQGFLFAPALPVEQARIFISDSQAQGN